MSLSVIDASAIVAFLAFDDPRGRHVGARLRAGDAFYAPTILDYEVLGALRGLARKDVRPPVGSPCCRARAVAVCP